MTTHAVSDAVVKDTCVFCAGAPMGCARCHGLGYVFRSAYSELSGVGGPTAEELEIERLRKRVAELEAEKAAR